MTVDGCIAAVEHLTSVNKLELFNSNRTSVDGYSLVAFANCIRGENVVEVIEDGVIVDED